LRENLDRAARIGIRQRRARDRPDPQVIVMMRIGITNKSLI
jgi:hypothetical protein